MESKITLMKITLIIMIIIMISIDFSKLHSYPLLFPNLSLFYFSLFVKH
jgi:hypothetical protein